MFGVGKRTVRILSIDGGGIRGLIPARILEELWRRLALHGKSLPFHRVFDLMAGTSAGGIITLALTLPRKLEDGRFSTTEAALRPEQVAVLFSDRGMDIFPHGRFPNLKSMAQAFRDKYNATALESMAANIFLDATVQDALTNVVVTSYDAERREPLLFKRRPKPDGTTDLNFYMRDAVRATTAAPTFFEPAYIQPVPPNGDHYCLIDSGLYANNPAMIAYVEARKIFPSARRFIIVSLGTGSTRRYFSYETLRSWGYLEWVNPATGVQLHNMSSDGQSRAVLHQLDHISEVSLYRFNAQLLESCSEAIDDVSPENLAGLAEVADNIIRENDEKLTRLSVEL